MSTRIGTIVLVSCFVTLAACERDGPLERAGEEVDEAIDRIGDGESAGERLDDAVDDIRDEAEDLREEAEEELRD